MKARLTVYTLGQVTILLDGQPVIDLTSRTAEALLIYLMHQKRPLSRQVLADFFWDDRAPERGAANLRTLLTMLRKPLDDFLTIARQTVAFDHNTCHWLDAAALEQEVEQLAPALEDPAPLDPHTVARLRTALDLYQGDFLEGFYLSESRAFEEWTVLVQERFRRLVAVGLRRLAAAYLDSGDYQAGIYVAERLLAIDSYNEEAHRQLMWLYVRSGQRNAALDQYQRCYDLLAKELGVEPAPATTALYERFRTLALPPPLRLPVESGPFVGREAELAEIRQRLCDPTCHLLTILGPGGIGKTRLAIEALAHLHQQRPGAFLDGLFFVPLASIESSALLSAAVADALQLPVDGGRELQDQLLAFLRGKELLLLLDNLEHLAAEPETIAFIRALLSEALGVKLLITARAPLQLREEWLFDIDGLACPPAEGEEVTDALRGYAAVQLFVRRAARLQRSFNPMPDEWAAIGRMCRLLSGMPLGLELASAWVRRHTCVEIATRLANDLDFLTSTLHDVPARHRSLRAVFKHSWQLLAPAEQSALCRLALFQGQIAQQSALAAADVTPAQLSKLADQSLLRRLERTGVFAMHEMIRQYALERLAATPMLEAESRQRYCCHFAAFLAQWGEALKGAGQQEAVQAISEELDNVRAAWRQAVSGSYRGELAQMLEPLHWYLWQRGYLQEGRATFAAAADALAAQKQPDDLLLARIRARLAEFDTWLAAYDSASSHLERAIPVLRRAEAWGDLGWALDAMGQIAYVQAAYSAARACFEEALTWFRRAEELAGLAQSLTALANVLCDEGAEYEAAKPLYEESQTLYKRLGDRYGEAKVTINLGAIAHDQRGYETAIGCYRQGIAICRELGQRQTLALVLNNLGQALIAQGRPVEAEAALHESAALRRELRERRGLALTLMSLGNLAAKQQEQRQAQQHYRDALRMARELGSPGLLTDLLVGLADQLGDWGHIEQAAALLCVVSKDAVEEGLVQQKVQALWARLETEDSAAVVTGRAQAAGKNLSVAADEALRWLSMQA